MTDKELVETLLSHLKSQPIIVKKKDYIEIQNTNYGEDIVFEFDENGKITTIYS